MTLTKKINTKTIFLIISFYLMFQIAWFYSHGVYINFDSTIAYIPQSELPLFSKEFFIGGNSYMASGFGMKARAYSYPLYLKLFGNSQTGLSLATVGQFLISLISWLCLSLLVAKKIKHPKIALFAFTSTILISLTNGVIVWNRAILAESLTISCFVWILILFMKWSETQFKSNFYLGSLIFLSLFFAGLRDTNPYFLILLSLFTIGYVWFTTRVIFSRAFIFFISMLICFLGNNYILNKSERWQLPFGATLVGRLLCQSDNSAVQYFRDKHNMPSVPSSLKVLQGTTYGWHYTLSNEPLALWIKTQGKQAYMQYLITHPYYTFIVPFLPIQQNFNQCPDLTKSLLDFGSGYKKINGFLYEMDYQRSLWLALISTSNSSVNHKGEAVTSWPTIFLIPIVDALCLCALLGFLWIFIIRKKSINKFNMMLLFAMFLLLSGIFLAIFIWHADSTAYPRHLILVAHQMSLASLWLFFFLLDELWTVIPKTSLVLEA